MLRQRRDGRGGKLCRHIAGRTARRMVSPPLRG